MIKNKNCKQTMNFRGGSSDLVPHHIRYAIAFVLTKQQLQKVTIVTIQQQKKVTNLLLL